MTRSRKENHLTENKEPLIEANDWPKCAFHGVAGHMVGSPTCHRAGGPKWVEPTEAAYKPESNKFGKNEPQVPDGAAYWWGR